MIVYIVYFQYIRIFEMYIFIFVYWFWIGSAFNLWLQYLSHQARLHSIPCHFKRLGWFWKGLAQKAMLGASSLILLIPVRQSGCKIFILWYMQFVLALFHCLILGLPRNGKRATVVSKDESAGRWEAHKGTMFHHVCMLLRFCRCQMLEFVL